MTTDVKPDATTQEESFGQKMAAAKRAKKAAKSATPPAALLDPDPVTSADVVPTSSRPAVRRPDVLSAPAALPAPPAEADITILVQELESVPLEALTYEQCGTLLNLLSQASTSIALCRRQRQEQLAAGTMTTPCETCKRPIDITKSGGFQILTIRDEHFQPRNVYFCSQNCLLGRGMPSHRTKKLPGDVGVPAR